MARVPVNLKLAYTFQQSLGNILNTFSLLAGYRKGAEIGEAKQKGAELRGTRTTGDEMQSWRGGRTV